MLKIEWKTCLKVGLSVFLVFLCIHYWSGVSDVLFGLLSAAVPLFVGCALAFIVNVLMTFYERHYFPRSQKRACIRSRRPVCLFLAYLSLICVIVLIFWVVIPELILCLQTILSKLPGVIQNAIKTISTWEFISDDLIASLSSVNWTERIGQLIELLGSGFGDVVNVLVNTVTSVFTGLFTAVNAIIFSIYLLSGKERLLRQSRRVLERYLPHRWTVRVRYFFRAFATSFRRYIVGQSTEALILGTLVTVGMLILGLPYATMIGALVMVMAFIPIAGAYISVGVGALMLLSDSPVKAIVFVLFFVVLQQIEGNLIYPRVVGSSLGLPPIWVLGAVTVGGGLFGILGMILAVPCTATLYCLIKNNLNEKTAEDLIGADDEK